MIPFVTCKHCGNPVVDNWEKCPSCGKDFRRKSFKPSSEAKHLIISSLVFVAVCGLAFLFSVIHDRRKTGRQSDSSYTASSRYSSSNKKPSWSSLYKPSSSSNKYKSKVSAVADTLDLSRCSDLAYVRKSKSVRAYQAYLEECGDSEFDDIWFEMELVVAVNCKRYRKLPAAEQKALEKVLEKFEEPMPRSMFFFVGSSEDEECAGPLEINTKSGSEGYIVKLSDAYGTNSTAEEFFFRAGDDVKINVPYGSYTLKYACGSKWYGNIIKFGLSAGYSKANSTLDFKRVPSWDGYTNTGHSLTLYKVVNGNLTTTSIDGEDF